MKSSSCDAIHIGKKCFSSPRGRSSPLLFLPSWLKRRNEVGVQKPRLPDPTQLSTLSLSPFPHPPAANECTHTRHTHDTQSQWWVFFVKINIFFFLRPEQKQTQRLLADERLDGVPTLLGVPLQVLGQAHVGVVAAVAVDGGDDVRGVAVQVEIVSRL
jgi:hypothetical protein